MCVFCCYQCGKFDHGFLVQVDVLTKLSCTVWWHGTFQSHMIMACNRTLDGCVLSMILVELAFLTFIYFSK
jgi:hypothetical protein